MKSFKKSLITTVGLAVVIGSIAFTDSLVTQAQRENRVIEWPSPEFSTLQSAIDAAPSGTTVEIRPGTYRINEPIFIRGKRLTIKGAGSGQEELFPREPGRRTGERVTRLVGPPPAPVVDERGNLILPAETVVGMFNLRAAEVKLKEMRLSGFDAGVVNRNDERGNAAAVRVDDCVIANTGRGVLSFSSAQLTVDQVSIYNPLWNGISVNSLSAIATTVKNTFVNNPQGAGMYFENTHALINAVNVTLAHEGGIVCFQSAASIVNSTLYLNQKFGILLIRCLQTPFINGNLIDDTLPYPFPECTLNNTCSWGDGIALVHSNVTVSQNTIVHSERAGLSNFGGHASMFDNTIECADGFELEGEDFLGQNYSFSDLAGNFCGCPSASGACIAVSAGFEPPPPVGP